MTGGIIIEKGAAYIRVSTEDQTEYSPDAQLREISRYAEKNGIEIIQIFRDEGISGRRADKRPGFMNMVAMAKNRPKPFDIILVHKFDRFARSREDSIVYKSLLRKECKIKVVSVSEQIEDDKFSLILESMLEAMAEYYSLNLGEEVKKGMTEKALRGELQTPAPFGYRIAAGILEPEPNEARSVLQIFEKYAAGASLRSIARDLNANGCKTIKGNSFDKRAIEYIICNPVYMGKIRWTIESGEEALITNGKHKALINPKLWEKANERRMLNKMRKGMNNFGRYDGSITTHWLRGLIKCAECGHTLAYCRGYNGRADTYRCNKYLTGGCITSQRVKLDNLEKQVTDALQIDTSTAFGTYIATESITPDIIEMIGSLKKQLKLNDTKRERARELVLSGIDSPEEYAASKAVLASEQRELHQRLTELKKTGAHTEIRSLYKMLTSTQYSNEDKNRMLKEIIKKIVYDKNGCIMEIHYYFFIMAQ